MSDDHRLFDWEGDEPEPRSPRLLRRPYRTDIAGEALIDGLAVVTIVFLVASFAAGALLALVGAAGHGANWLAGGGLLSGLAFGGRLSATDGKPPVVQHLEVAAVPGLLLVLAVVLAAVAGVRSEHRRPSRSQRHLRGRALLTGLGALVAEVLLVLGTRSAGAFGRSALLARAGVPLPSMLLGALTIPAAANVVGRLVARLRDAPWLERWARTWDRWRSSVGDVIAFWVASGALALLAGLALVLTSPMGIQGLSPAVLALPFDAGSLVLLGGGVSLRVRHSVHVALFGLHLGRLRSHELGLFVGGLGVAKLALVLVPLFGVVAAGAWLGHRRRAAGDQDRFAWGRAGRAALVGAVVAFVVAAVGSVAYVRSGTLGPLGLGARGSWSWALSEWGALVAGAVWAGATSLFAPVLYDFVSFRFGAWALPRLHWPRRGSRPPAESRAPLAMADGRSEPDRPAEPEPQLDRAEPASIPSIPSSSLDSPIVGREPPPLSSERRSVASDDPARTTGTLPLVAEDALTAEPTTELPTQAGPAIGGAPLGPGEPNRGASTASSTLGELATTWHGGRASGRHRWLTWGIVVVVVLAAGALAGFFWVRHQERLVDSPTAVARTYLSDLASGRATSALGLAATRHSGPLLGHDAFEAERANAALRAISVGRASLDASGKAALVPVSFELGGRRYHETLRVVRGATVDLVLHRWALAHATVRLALPSDVGAPMLVDGQAVPAGSTVRVLPGLVRLRVGKAGWLDARVSGSASAGNGLVEAVQPGETLHLAVSLRLSTSGKAGVEAAVTSAFDQCLASTSLTPSGCPFADGAFVFFGARSVHWSALRPLFDSSTPPTFKVLSARSVLVSGTYKVQVRYKAPVVLFGSKRHSAVLSGPFVAEVSVPSDQGGTGSARFLSPSSQPTASTSTDVPGDGGPGQAGGPGRGLGKKQSPGSPGPR